MPFQDHLAPHRRQETTGDSCSFALIAINEGYANLCLSKSLIVRGEGPK
jgi:hypothetical protein